MALPKVPIPVQLSPSTYMLLAKFIDLCVDQNPLNDDLTIKGGPTGAVQTAITTFFTALTAATGGVSTPAELQRLLTDGLAEAEAINKNARSQVAMPC